MTWQTERINHSWLTNIFLLTNQSEHSLPALVTRWGQAISVLADDLHKLPSLHSLVVGTSTNKPPQYRHFSMKWRKEMKDIRTYTVASNKKQKTPHT